MTNKAAQLKEVNAKAKVLREEQKALRAELDAGKETRKEARKIQAQCRKDVAGHKASLRKLEASVYETFSGGDTDTLDELADAIMEDAAALAGCVRKFAEAGKDPVDEI